jgi:threonine synthase
MPVTGFIAAMNMNNAFGDFIRGKEFTPRQPIATISPALDVCVPSNYERLCSFYEEAPAVMRNMVFPDAIDDRTTIETMEQVWKQYDFFLDPHTAVAFAAAERLASSHDLSHTDAHFVILSTGHPAKSMEAVAKATGKKIEMPEKLVRLQKKTDPIAIIDPQLDALEGAIVSCF